MIKVGIMIGTLSFTNTNTTSYRNFGASVIGNTLSKRADRVLRRRRFSRGFVAFLGLHPILFPLNHILTLNLSLRPEWFDDQRQHVPERQFRLGRNKRLHHLLAACLPDGPEPLHDTIYGD